jgi:transcriptional regulator with XRE-family HTH domain
MHKKKVMIDLKIARRKHGLLQSDLAHLLNTTQARISRLELGDALLTAADLHKISLIYDGDVRELFVFSNQAYREELREAVASMSGEITKDENLGETRQRSLHSLSERLSVDNLQ